MTSQVRYRPPPAPASPFRTLGELLDLALEADGRLPGLMGYPAQLRQRFCEVTTAPVASRGPCTACGTGCSTLVDGVLLHLRCPDPDPAVVRQQSEPATRASSARPAAAPGQGATGAAASQDSQPQLLAGALDSAGLWLPGAETPVQVPWPRNAGEAYTLADRYQLRQLWIHPSAHQQFGIPDTHGDNPQAPEQHPWMTADGIDCDPPGLAAWVNLRPRDGRRRRALMFTGYERADRANWKQASSGKVLAAAVAAFNEQMPPGCYYYYSPNETSGSVILHHDRGKLAAVEPPPPAAGQVRHIRRWSRMLGSDEEGATWLHPYDTNAQQLAVWNVRLGQGQAVHWAAPQWGKAHRRTPGYWLTRKPEGWQSNVALPNLFILWERSGEPAVWLPTPYLELLDDLGAPLAIDEAWVWPQSSAWLEAAGKTFKHARAALTARGDEAAAVARTVIKQTYASRVGEFSPHAGRPERRAELVRPDVTDMIIAKAFANDYRRMIKIGKQSGRWPVAIYADAVYYAADGPDPEASAPAGLVIGAGLGEYSIDPADSVPVGVIADQLGGSGFVRAVERYRNRKGPR